MTIRTRLLAIAGSVALAVAAAAAQTAQVPPVPPGPGQVAPGPGCLHKDQETTMQRERRLEAIEAMRLIDRAHAAQRPWRSTGWEELAQSAAVQSYRADGSATGQLARKIKWGEAEPLPGWRVMWKKDVIDTFVFMDVWDPCRFTLSSEDKAVIPGPRVGLVPLETQ